jgi:DNA-binding transcriptional LysR family regulator
LELAFLTLPPNGDARLKYQRIWDDPLVFVAAPFHPLAEKSNLSLKDLIDYPSILPALQTYTSQITLAEFEKQGLKPRMNMLNNSLEAIRMLASIGTGWSVLPKTMLNADLKQLDVDIKMQRQLGIVWHPNRTQSKALEALIEMFK